MFSFDIGAFQRRQADSIARAREFAEKQKAEDVIEAEIHFDFKSFHLEIKRLGGEKELKISGIYLWHFPQNGRPIVVDGVEKPVQNSKWMWLDPLPNFDPFEDKGKGYYSDCQIV